MDQLARKDTMVSSNDATTSYEQIIFQLNIRSQRTVTSQDTSAYYTSPMFAYSAPQYK